MPPSVPGQRPLLCGTERVRLVEATEPGQQLTPFVRDNRHAIESLVAEYGAALMRGFAIDPEQGFFEAVRLLTHSVPYLYRSTPRTELRAGVYTATEYPAAREIPFHCENAYQRTWPQRLLFMCARAATSGGETPLADVEAVTRSLDPALIARFAEHGVMYVRHYHPGADLSWQNVFQASEPGEVEQYCRSHEIAYQWLPDGVLRTQQVCQATARHPHTGRHHWFNQAHLFHPSSLEPALHDSLLQIYGAEALPRNAYLGDGSAIDVADLAAVRRAFAANSFSFPWHSGDLLLLDNMMLAHARRSFTGPRQVLVAMGNPVSG